MDTPLSIREIIIKKYHEKKTQIQISLDTDIPRSTISGIIKRYKESGQIGAQRNGKCGRKRKLSDRIDRALAKQALLNPKATSRTIQTAVGLNAMNVSLNTIKRSLIRSGLSSYRPLISPSLSKRQKDVRYKWCKLYEKWDVFLWKKVE